MSKKLPPLKCFAVTSLVWLCIISCAYGYIITNQILIIPSQRGYMEVKHNDMIARPASFEVERAEPNELDNFVNQVISEK